MLDRHEKSIIKPQTFYKWISKPNQIQYFDNCQNTEFLIKNIVFIVLKSELLIETAFLFRPGR